ncbi:hypothetical protein [Vitreimonas flagellata]|uniref:hypothetical protein n=1 Tax=Vitreimonas flagellata TaxID=2560861 RepID=UPI00107578B4|nr:hypothetical protein [Vitreimonas flagellata]
MSLDPVIAQRNLDLLKADPHGSVLLRNLHWSLDSHFAASAPGLRQNILDALASALAIDEPSWSKAQLAQAAAARIAAYAGSCCGPDCYQVGARENDGFAHAMHLSGALQQPASLIDDLDGAIPMDEDADLPSPRLRAGAILGHHHGMWWFTHYSEILDASHTKRTGEDLLALLGFPADRRSGHFILVSTPARCAQLTTSARRPTALDGPEHSRLKVGHLDATRPPHFGATADLTSLPPAITDGVMEAVAPPLALDGIITDLDVFCARSASVVHDEDLHFQSALESFRTIDVVVADLKRHLGLP